MLIITFPQLSEIYNFSAINDFLQRSNDLLNSISRNNFVITFNLLFMDVSVIPIGNSKGIRLTKTLLDKYNIGDTVELILEKDCIILKPKAAPRKGWGKALKKMHENGDDKLLIPDMFEDEKGEEWS